MLYYINVYVCCSIVNHCLNFLFISLKFFKIRKSVFTYLFLTTFLSKFLLYIFSIHLFNKFKKFKNFHDKLNYRNNIKKQYKEKNSNLMILIFLLLQVYS